MQHHNDSPYLRKDPPGEDFLLPPCVEEIKERARTVHEHNQQAIRYFVEELAWGTFHDPEIRRHLLPLLWLVREVDLRWVAEAFCMEVRDVCALVEGNAPWTFNCLQCGRELLVTDRPHLWRMNHSLKAIISDKGTVNENHRKHLLCPPCVERRARDTEAQRLLDEKRLRAMLDEYRSRPYADRRRSEEWSILKRRVHSRDKYRCRMCGRDDIPLHLHHCTYINYGEEQLEDLITLCEVCHRHHHHLQEAS